MAPGEQPLSCDILVLCWGHLVGQDRGRTRWADPVWAALLKAFGIARTDRGKPYDRDFHRVLAELYNYKLLQERRDRVWLLHPPIEGRFGRYHSIDVGGQRVCILRSDLRLNTGGPTMPVLAMLSQLIEQAEPKLVLSVGLGGGATAEQRVGDVVVSSQARFRLDGELKTSSLNGKTFGGHWQPRSSWFGQMRFEPLQDPALISPSQQYGPPDAPDEPVRPPPHTPRVRVVDAPVVTCPRLTSHGFSLSTIRRTDSPSEPMAAVEMDGAPVAAACDGRADCGFIVGLAVPALYRFSADHGYNLRRAWGDIFMAHSCDAAAENCAQVVRHVCRQHGRAPAAD